jgi:hypothetical protein
MQCGPVRSILSFGVLMRAVILLVTVLTSTESIAREKLDFVFFDATGRLYQTSKLAEGLADQGWNSDKREGAKVLLIETPSLKDPRYTHEMSMLDAPGTISEDDKILYVVSCFDQEFVSGYHTSKQVAHVLGHSRARFRVRLLDEHGAVLHHSAEPISGKTLRKWLRE